MSLADSDRSFLRRLVRGAFGESAFRSVRSLRRIGTPYERARDEPWSDKLWAWSRGFRARSVNVYERSRVVAGEYLSDEARDFECRRLNGVPSMFDHKLLLRTVLAKAGVRVPHLEALVWEFGAVMSPDAEPRRVPVQELVAHLVSQGGKFIWKPEDGLQGVGVRLLQVEDGGLVSRRGEDVVAFDMTCNRNETFLVERALTQHAFWSSLWPGSVNTMRIHTMWTPGDDAPFIGYATQRIGTRATFPTDNWSGGGLMALIDLESGTLSDPSRAPAKYGQPVAHFADHPDTGTRLEGVILPDWERIKAFTLDAASRLPYQSNIGWDIAVDSSGEPTVIEANDNPGIQGIQSHVGLLTIPAVRRFYEKTGVI